MKFINKIKQLYTSTIEEQNNAFEKEVKDKIEELRPGFERRIENAANAGKTFHTFVALLTSENKAYHRLAEEYGLISDDSIKPNVIVYNCISDVIVSGWAKPKPVNNSTKPKFPENTLITEGENL